MTTETSEFKSPFVKVLSENIENFHIPENTKQFLIQTGLPSNALYFVENETTPAIMTFDSLACLRYLKQEDIAIPDARKSIQADAFIIIGVFGKLYVCISEKDEGAIFLINSSPMEYIYMDENNENIREVQDQITFLNTSAQQFLECLMAYKEFSSKAKHIGDFTSDKIRNELALFKKKILSFDSKVFSYETSYWSLIIDDLDIW